ASSNITTLSFAFAHRLSVNSSFEVNFDILQFIYSGIHGSFFVAMRIYTESLLLPILAHSWSNISFYLL
ncbi:uncharacterized protein METZ01_LOCUS171447, partial [marine metagenome]